MSVSIDVQAYSGKNSEEFKKHYGAVKFCVENGLSYPKETSEFFAGKVSGESLEAYDPKQVLKLLSNGISCEIPTRDKYNDPTIKNYNEVRINISEIPKHAEELVIKLSY